MSEAAAFLGPEGPLARQIPGYEDRPGQRDMARLVEDCLAGGESALVEAGTGVGKTMAYLVPAILSGKRVVISTGTRALQDQLALGDLPLLTGSMATPFRFTVVKGVSNYLCQRRMAKALPGLGPQTLDPDPRLRDDLETIWDWAANTSSGDLAELTTLNRPSPALPLVTTTADARLGSRCPYHSRCFVARARMQAQDAEIIVVNHHLFFADLALRQERSKLLPSYDAVIFDEAHLIEDAITQHFSIAIGAGRLGALWDDITTFLRSLARTPHSALRQVVRARTLGNILLDQAGQALDGEESATLDHGFGQQAQWQERWFGLDEALASLAGDLSDIADEHGDDEPGASEVVELARTLAQRSDRLRNDLAGISEQDSAGYVYWAERRSGELRIGGSPVAAGAVVRDHLMGGDASVIMTSATLSADGHFDFVKQRLGLAEEVTSQSFASPFDYSTQALLYVPSDLPLPAEPGFSAASNQRIAELCHLTSGGALVLFTSHQALADGAKRLQGKLPGPLLVQGQSTSAELIHRLRTEGNATLLATGSFWQGIDVPGDGLRLLICAKLPFAAPGDPVASARARLVEEDGGSAFIDYILPRSVLTLRQGLGRLIRRMDDRGLLAVLDKRLVQKQYGRVFMDSLPEGLRRTSSFEQARRFWSDMHPRTRALG